jgi:hypothetical protein
VAGFRRREPARFNQRQTDPVRGADGEIVDSNQPGQAVLDRSCNTIPIDFDSDPAVVRILAEGERLAYGQLFNPAFATEISMIDPLPHHRIAVYDHMLPSPACAFSWEMSWGQARLSWPGSPSARCWSDACCVGF